MKVLGYARSGSVSRVRLWTRENASFSRRWQGGGVWASASAIWAARREWSLSRCGAACAHSSMRPHFKEGM